MPVATAATANGPPALGPPRHSLSVAVIGAGAAGLAATRELLLEGHSVRVFEAADRVGGVWVYTDAVEDDPLGTRPDRSRLHSSMYAGLRTNLPREVMGYACFPFDTQYNGKSGGCLDPRRFCTHQEVLNYLEAFAARFGLLKYIQFGTKVTLVEPVAGSAAASSNGSALAPPPAEWPRWQVRWRPSAGGDETTEQFDAVMVCNGHYSEPRVPHFPGQDVFFGAQTHSHNYRYPDAYIGKRAVLVGAAFSGMDIAQELADAGAAAVYLSAREWTDPATGEAPDGSSVNKVPAGTIVLLGNVVELGADGAVTFDGGVRVEAVDEVIYTTGYVYRFPFLEGTSAAQEIEDNRIVGLYKHVLPPHLAPTLSFIGIPWKVVPFPQFELQARWVARTLAGRVVLPKKTEMEADVASYYRFMENEGLAQRYTHRAAGELQSEYNLWLSGAAGDGDAGWPAWRAQLYTKTGELRRATGLGFREAPMEDVAGEALEAAVVEAARVRAWLEAEGSAVAAMAPLRP